MFITPDEYVDDDDDDVILDTDPNGINDQARN